MKILMIHNQYNKVGGEDISVRTELLGLKRAGVDVDLFAVENHVLDGRPVRAAADAVMGSRGDVDHLRQIIAKWRPDIIHVQNLFPRLGARALEVIQTAGIPWVRSLRNYRKSCIAATHYRANSNCNDCLDGDRFLPGIAHACYRNSIPASIAATIYSHRERKVMNHAKPSAHIAISEWMAAYSKRIDPEIPVYVKSNSVDVPIGPLSEPEEAPQGILFAGRLTCEKGLEDIQRLASALPDIFFEVAGGIDDSAQLSGNLRILGTVAHDELLERMAKARFLIVPSRWDEPFGRVAVEAMSQGTPAIVSKNGGLPEISRRVDERLVLDFVGTPAAQIRELMELDQTDYLQLRLEAKRQFDVNYSLESTTAALIAIYRDVV